MGTAAADIDGVGAAATHNGMGAAATCIDAKASYTLATFAARVSGTLATFTDRVRASTYRDAVGGTTAYAALATFADRVRASLPALATIDSRTSAYRDAVGGTAAYIDATALSDMGTFAYMDSIEAGYFGDMGTSIHVVVQGTSRHGPVCITTPSIVDVARRRLVGITSPWGRWRGNNCLKAIVKPSVIDAADGIGSGRRDHVRNVEISLCRNERLRDSSTQQDIHKCSV